MSANEPFRHFGERRLPRKRSTGGRSFVVRERNITRPVDHSVNVKKVKDVRKTEKSWHVWEQHDRGFDGHTQEDRHVHRGK